MISENGNIIYSKDQSGEVIWRSPSNIALVKYWGKRSFQLPMNPSLSFVLNFSYTDTSIKYKAGNGSVDFLLAGKKINVFENRIKKYFDYLQAYLPFIKDYNFSIYSSNTFPHSAGIASSASAFSSIALCLMSISENLSGQKTDQFFQDASFLARLGSGSASRSVYPGYSLWGKYHDIPYSSDEYAIAFNEDINNIFQDIHDAILIVDSTKKKVSSSYGHQLMNSHPFAEERYRQASSNVSRLLNVLRKNEWNEFASIVENEALSLHAMMMTSAESFILMRENTLALITKIREAREQKGLQICFTLDAGPNIHLLYPAKEKEKVSLFIEKELTGFLENASWIDDRIGKGPELIKNILNE